ncbi:class I SAM-dependent methyltransferase [Patescibacteria group bacterium]
MNNNYKNYFKRQYKVKFSSTDLENFNKWFYPQWKLINNLVNLSKEQRVLEIGSGYGGLFGLIKQTNFSSYVGLELDSSACSFSNKYFRINNFKNIAIEKYKSTKKFDTIYAFEVLEHLEDPSNAINKIYDLLNTDGLFVGTSPYPFKKNVLADNTHKYVLHPTSWEKLFVSASFSSVELHAMSFVPFVWRLNKYLNFRMPFYVPFKHIISTCLIVAKK